MANSYFEDCSIVAACIDIEGLQEFNQANTIGYGSGFKFSSLGRLSIPSCSTDFVGIKQSTRSNNEAISRIQKELAFIATMLEYDPSFRPLVPAFMNLVTVAGAEDKVAILTEDASRDRQIDIWPFPASDAVRHMLYKPYSSLGTMDEVLQLEECDRTLSFEVGGTERLLDFTPYPIKDMYKDSNFIENLMSAIDVAQNSMISVSASSPFGILLSNAR
jgi:hypothetical protein